MIRLAALAAACALVAGCSAHQRAAGGSAKTETAQAAPAEAQAATQGEPDKPQKVAAKGKAVADQKAGRFGSGLASWYGGRFHGRRTANGERFDMYGFTAAHPTAPLPSYVRVTNVSNGRSIVVRVNDRGPYRHGRVIDVSKRTAEVLGFTRAGVGNVKMDFVGRAPEDGSDERKLIATYQEFGRPAAPEGMQVAALQPISDARLASEAGALKAAPAPVLVASTAPGSEKASAPTPPQAPTAYAAAQPQTAPQVAVAATRVATAAEPSREARAALAKAAAAKGGTSAKRVVEPSEPVLASAAPALRTSVDAPSEDDVEKQAGAKANVASRIAASFEGFGDAAFASASGQDLGSAAAYNAVR